MLAKKIDEDVEEQPSQEVDPEAVRTKVRSLGKVLKMYSMLRQERETLVKLRGLNGTGLLPRGILIGGPDKLKEGALAPVRRSLTWDVLLTFLQRLATSRR